MRVEANEWDDATSTEGDYEEFEVDTETNLSDSSEPMSCGERVTALAKNDTFSYVVGLVILSNTIVMWLEVDYSDWGIWPMVEYTLLVFFMFELSVRLWAFGCGFFTGDDCASNIFDFVIVMFGVIDVVIRELMSFEHGKLTKFVTLCRAMRLLRILRMVRVFKTFRQLYLLARGLVASVVSVGWIAMLFLMVIVVFAIFFTNFLGHSADSFQDAEAVRTYFGTVTASMTTLFQFVTLDDWSHVARTVTDEEPIYFLFFVFYILITSFTILSVLTGVVSEKILSVSRGESDQMQKEAQEEREQLQGRASDLYKKAKRKSDGLIGKTQFRHLVTEDFVDTKKEFHYFGLVMDDWEQDDMVNLFCTIAQDKPGLSEDEFFDGLLRLGGPAMAKDVLILQADVQAATKALESGSAPGKSEQDQCAQFAATAHKRLDEMINTTQWLIKRVKLMEGRFENFMASIPAVHK